MEIRKLEKRENLRTRPLYEEAFPEDRGAFANYYYTYVAPHSTVYAVCDGDAIQSMVHLNPYVLSWNGERITIPYLVAVATRERMRRRGLMRSLLERIFRDLDEEKVPFAFLMPADEAIYRPFGFVRTWDWQWEEDVVRRLADDGEQVRAAELGDEDLTHLADHVNGMLSGRFELFTVRSCAYYRRLQREQTASGGELMIRMRDGQPVAAVQTARENYPPMMCRVMNREAYESRLRGAGDEPFRHAYVCEVV